MIDIFGKFEVFLKLPAAIKRKKNSAIGLLRNEVEKFYVPKFLYEKMYKYLRARIEKQEEEINILKGKIDERNMEYRKGRG